MGIHCRIDIKDIIHWTGIYTQNIFNELAGMLQTKHTSQCIVSFQVVLL